MPGRSSNILSAAARLCQRIDALGRISDERGRLTRTFLSPAMQQANAVVEKWIHDAGGMVREDALGNLVGRWEASRAAAAAAAPTLLLGSHLDTVRDAGRFDGPLGVLLPIVALEELRRRRVWLPFAVEVLGFSEEEGVRFSSAYLGSKGYIGKLRAPDLRRRDADGVTVQQAIEARYQRPFVAPKARRRRDLAGYIEVHIEQGPVLEAENLAVGVVSAIAGQTRGQVTLLGRAGHAGTTPMALRRDALAGAAELILFVEARAKETPGLVATVGTLQVPNGAPNVIPGRVVLSLDVRHAVDSERERALRNILARGKEIARRRRLEYIWQQTQENAAVTCAPELTRGLDESVRSVQGRSLSLVSGAGHDGVVMSEITPVAMLFVRCREGLSHHPDELAAPRDIAVALEVMIDFLTRFGQKFSP